MKASMAAGILAAALAAQSQEAPKVYVTSKSTGNTWAAMRDQTQEVAKNLAKECPEVGITVNSQQSDYQVELSHIEVGYFVRDNQIAVTDMFGNVLSTLETDSIKKGVKQACTLVRKDWLNRPGARPKLLNYINDSFQKEGVLGYAELSGDKLTVHCERASLMRFHMIVANPRTVSYLQRAGIAAYAYTNDADQSFLYDVKAGQVISPPPQPAVESATSAATAAENPQKQ